MLYFSRTLALPFPMVAPVPPQISKLRPVYPPHRPSAPCQLSLPTTRCRLSFGHPFVFMLLQIPLPASSLFSHPSKSPGGVGVQASNLPPNSCLCGKSIVFRYLPPLFPKNPGGGYLDPRTGRLFDAQNVRQPSATWTWAAHPTIISRKLKVPGPWMKAQN